MNIAAHDEAMCKNPATGVRMVGSKIIEASELAIYAAGQLPSALNERSMKDGKGRAALLKQL